MVSDLASRECVPCRGGIPPLRGDALQELLRALGGGWEVVAEHHLTKVFTFPDFRSALDYAVRVGELAEEEGHHPDITVSYGKCTIVLYTHKIDGLAEADFVLAAKIDRLAGES